MLDDTQKKYIVSTTAYQVRFPGVHPILQVDPQSYPISGVLKEAAFTQQSHFSNIEIKVKSQRITDTSYKFNPWF